MIDVMIVNAHDEDQGVAEKIGENIAQAAGKKLTVNGYHRGSMLCGSIHLHIQSRQRYVGT
jgi:hypothetical protein